MQETQPPAKKRGRPAKVKMDKPFDLGDVDIKPIKALVIACCANPSWVTAKLDGFRIEVKCPTWAAKSLVGKEIKVELVPSDIGNYYEYVK
jgi:hypothetical protein